jgi:hypothetical protein
MTHTDCWGREFDTIEAALAAQPERISERPIFWGNRYLGLLAHYRSVGWTHSLQSHGTAAFVSPDLAEQDFYETKARLPQSVHRAIFGHERVAA